MNKYTILPEKKIIALKNYDNKFGKFDKAVKNRKPEILLITSYPPRQCGIATYSYDLVKTLRSKFRKSFVIKIASLENRDEHHQYKKSVQYVLRTDLGISYQELSQKCNQNKKIELIVIQHEFGLFKDNETDFISFLKSVSKPIIIVLHTVLPNPDSSIINLMNQINSFVQGFIVMTAASAQLLEKKYNIKPFKITVIPHGTHLVKYEEKKVLKKKYGFSGRKILSTFGLLSSGKSIETTLDALPAIIEQKPNILFLIIGKTHPTVVKNEGESYRESLMEKITVLKLERNVKFINAYLPLEELLEYLQLTDIYLFTSKDPNQAVSGTFSYAVSCGCPVISTPIPHADEVLQDGNGIIIEFGNSAGLSQEVIKLLNDNGLRKKIVLNGIQKIAATAWENSAISHAMLFKKIIGRQKALQYTSPKIDFNHLKKLTAPFGIVQFSVLNKPNKNSGFTLDDNARALIVVCQNYLLKREPSDLKLITIYYNFIKYCQQIDGTFLKYVDREYRFTCQNNENIQDSNGLAIWALGYMLSIGELLPEALLSDAKKTINKAITAVESNYGTRPVAFILKGLCYYNKTDQQQTNIHLIKKLANRLVKMYQHETKSNWKWFESDFTYANSTVPESLLCAYDATGDTIYEFVAKESFDFLLSKMFLNKMIKVISNKGIRIKNDEVKVNRYARQQPVEVCYTILALSRFEDHFKKPSYLKKMKIAFSWYLGNNHLNRIIYNPCTAGCYDGLEENYINLNQGAESTICYLMASLTMKKSVTNIQKQSHTFLKTNIR